MLALFGATASGKTQILLNLFAGGKGAAEVVSADSVQVYRGMDIGTAKPAKAEREALPHHLVDILEPSEKFDCGSFVRLADAACLDIARRGKVPVLSGGCGFYLKNFILGLPQSPPSDEGIRAGLKRELLERGAAALMEELAAGDPVSAGRIHINDEYRLLRALEVLRLCKRPLSSFAPSGEAGGRPRYDFLAVGIRRPREELYRRINLRAKAMFDEGLPSEVRGLFEKGYTPDAPGMRAIGYREFFVEEPGGEAPQWRLSEDAAGVQALVAQNSRRYAKRQGVFFASIPGVKWIDAGQSEEQTMRSIQACLEGFAGRL